MTKHEDSEKVQTGVRRVVGIAALRRLRALVDAENAQGDAEARALPRVLVVVVVLVALLLMAPPMRQLLGRLWGGN